MNTKSELNRKLRANDLDASLTVVNTRLKQLRHERHLVERAIIALRELSLARQSRARRAARN
jgi:hypothetical protein